MKLLRNFVQIKYDERGTHRIINIMGVKIKFKAKYPVEKMISETNASFSTLPGIPYMETHLCDHCNLKCTGCGHACHLIDEEIFTDLEQYVKDINELARKIDIKKIRLMGGEPLLHPQVNEFMAATRKAYPKADIRLVTNGILLPSMPESFWVSCRQNKIIIDMSKYPIVGNKFAEYLDLLGDNKVRLGTIHFAKTFFDLTNEKGDSDENKSWAACISKNCVTLWQSKLWSCSTCFRIYSNKVLNQNLGLPSSLDIYKTTGEEIVKVMNKPSPACKYCYTPDKAKVFPWSKYEPSNEKPLTSIN